MSLICPLGGTVTAWTVNQPPIRPGLPGMASEKVPPGIRTGNVEETKWQGGEHSSVPKAPAGRSVGVNERSRWSAMDVGSKVV